MEAEHIPFAGKHLTPKERDFISKSFLHSSDKEVCGALGISSTALNNRKRILFERFGWQNKTQMLLAARDYGFDADGTFHPRIAARLGKKKKKKGKG